jgi:hypothetical protein
MKELEAAQLGFACDYGKDVFRHSRAFCENCKRQRL